MKKQQIERVDRLTDPLVVGRHYLVWMVHGKWCGRTREWPVIGPRHQDKEFFSFSVDHYHIDSRFLPANAKYRGDVLTYPFYGHPAKYGEPAVPLGEPVLRRRKCIKADAEINIPYHADPRPLGKMHAHYAGHQCTRGKAGWICPHRKASLGNVVSVDGVITCPLHLLKIDAETGIVLPVRE